MLCSSSFAAVGLYLHQSKHPVRGQRENLNHSRLFYCSSIPVLAIPVITFSDYWLYTKEVSQHKISPDSNVEAWEIDFIPKLGQRAF